MVILELKFSRSKIKFWSFLLIWVLRNKSLKIIFLNSWLNRRWRLTRRTGTDSQSNIHWPVLPFDYILLISIFKSFRFLFLLFLFTQFLKIFLNILIFRSEYSIWNNSCWYNLTSKSLLTNIKIFIWIWNIHYIF